MAKKERPALAQRLRDTARAANLTSDDLAARLGVSPSTVRVWWTGRNEPPAAALAAYADAVGAPVEWIITGRLTDPMVRSFVFFANQLGAGGLGKAALTEMLGEMSGDDWFSLTEKLLTEEQRAALLRRLLEAARDRRQEGQE